MIVGIQSRVRLNKWELALNPAHLLKITDDTGLFQHCRFTIPDRNHGYTLDDNARALIVAARSVQPILLARLPTYLGFVMYCQRPDGLFRNFMDYDRHFLEEVGSPDSQGRTMWALGILYAERLEYRPLVDQMLVAFRPQLRQLKSIRAIAFAILGVHHYLAVNPLRQDLYEDLKWLAGELMQVWQTGSKNPDWPWFEDFLTYENARLPQALFAAYLTTRQSEYLVVARKATAFLEQVHFAQGYLKLVGNDGWYHRTKKMADFDEQPVDAGALVELFNMAYQATGEAHYAEVAQAAFDWYLGWNCHGLSLYDAATGGCYDALTASGVNLNQGAESVLSYQMALQSLLRTPQPVVVPGYETALSR